MKNKNNQKIGKQELSKLRVGLGILLVGGISLWLLYFVIAPEIKQIYFPKHSEPPAQNYIPQTVNEITTPPTYQTASFPDVGYSPVETGNVWESTEGKYFMSKNPDKLLVGSTSSNNYDAYLKFVPAQLGQVSDLSLLLCVDYTSCNPSCRNDFTIKLTDQDPFRNQVPKDRYQFFQQARWPILASQTLQVGCNTLLLNSLAVSSFNNYRSAAVPYPLLLQGSGSGLYSITYERLLVDKPSATGAVIAANASINSLLPSLILIFFIALVGATIEKRRR